MKKKIPRGTHVPLVPSKMLWYIWAKSFIILFSLLKIYSRTLIYIMQIHIIHITYYIYWCNLNLGCLKIEIILEVFTLIIPYFINLPFQRNLTANRHFQLIKGCNPIFDVSVDLTSTLIKGSNPILVSSRLITYTIVKECNPICVVVELRLLF